MLQNKSIHFTGKSYGGTIKAEGKIYIIPVDNFTTRIEYSFELFGAIGNVIGIFRKKDVVSGTEAGLANIVKLCEEAQKSQHVIMN